MILGDFFNYPFSTDTTGLHLEKRQIIDPVTTSVLPPVPTIPVVTTVPVAPTTPVRPTAPVVTSSTPNPSRPTVAVSGTLPPTPNSPSTKSPDSSPGASAGLIIGLIAGAVVLSLLGVYSFRKWQLKPSKAFKNRMNPDFQGFAPPPATRGADKDSNNSNRNHWNDPENANTMTKTPDDSSQTMTNQEANIFSGAITLDAHMMNTMAQPMTAVYVDHNGTIVDPSQIYYDPNLVYAPYPVDPYIAGYYPPQGKELTAINDTELPTAHLPAGT